MDKIDSASHDRERQVTESPFVQARLRLNLSQKELAERLNTSFHALVRWERGDTVPSQDVLLRLNNLLDPENSGSRCGAPSSRRVVFESSGARSRSAYLPLFDTNPVPVLAEPRASLLSDLLKDEFWGDSDLALAEILTNREKSAATRETPLDEEISAGKNTYTYDAHTYHTKVPPQGIANVIHKYLPDGGVVLDPFSGSGMTGVAARYLGYDVILNELSPAASFISQNFVRRVNIDEFGNAVVRIMETLSDLRKRLYHTTCRECGADVEQQFTVWSYRLECNHCGERFVLWDHCRKYGRTVREHKLLRKFPCPHCRKEISKSHLKRFAPIPVFLGYRCCSKKIIEHPLEEHDLKRIEDARTLLSEYEGHFPDHPLPDGVNLNQPKRHGLDTVKKLYTERNLLACAAIWKEIRRVEDPDLASAVAFVFTSLYQRVTRLSEYRFWGGSGNTANLNVPQICNEINVFITFDRKAKSISDHFVTTAENFSGRWVVRTGSATDLGFLPDNSVDFIFTDPPFGANINYSEMNVLWESWLGAFTDPASEAIISRAQGKGVGDYKMLMQRSLAEACRVLRTNHWMVLVFMNSSEKVWNALRSAIEEAGFVIEKINIFDKQHGTFKQFVSENTAGADLMIHCRKSETGHGEHAVLSTRAHCVAQFIKDRHSDIPVMPFLHVRREAEVDYRTLYSRYVAEALHTGSRIVGFAEFRQSAARALGETP